MTWVLVRFEDGVLSDVIRAVDIENEEGLDGMHVKLTVGDECLAPWKSNLFPGKILLISGINNYKVFH